MIRSIVAIDESRGMTTDSGIPWELPTDGQHFEQMTWEGDILMGYGACTEFQQRKMPKNYVDS